MMTDEISLVNSNNGVIAGDMLTIKGSRVFSDTSVGSAKPVTIQDIKMSGVDSSNYSLNKNSTDTFGNITPKSIVLTADAQNKIYDGTVSEAVAFSSKGILPNDKSEVVISGLAAFTDKSAGTGKTVNITNIALSGKQGANYLISSTKLTTTATINPLAININAVGDKIYDGSINDVVTLSSNGILRGDTVNFLNKSALFSDKNVGDSKTLTISGISMTGKDAGNYLVSGNATTTADITPKGVTVTASGTNKVYDGETSAQVTLSTGLGVIKGDNLTLSSTSTFKDTSAGLAKTITVADIVAGGIDKNNYTLNNTATKTTASITPKPITVSAKGIDKVYDGNLVDKVTLTSNDILSKDINNISLSAVASLTNKNVGIAKTVNVTNISVTGTQSNNYSIKNTTTTALATVTSKPLNIVVTGKDKIYDGLSTDVVSISSNDIVSGDNVTFINSSAGFADKNVNIVIDTVVPKIVTVSGIGLMGKDAANYTLSSNSATTNAKITPKGLTVVATGINKVYDATTDVLVSLSAGIGLIKGDSLGFTDTSALLDTKNVGIGKNVSVTGIKTTGVDKSNYFISNSTAMTKANVTPLPIFITAIGIDKSFDGTLTDTVSLSSLGLFKTDSISLTDTSAKFSTSTVGLNKAVTVTGINTTGTDAANYSVINKTIITSASINAKN
jgi:hypothetical protein